ncbi:hypothetical protein PF011_g2797 [Phytophthora fragariae]|uniref:Uncharacterized protein n=1 Tax=Phytophthora fragariae TaxID=53985 RepID=A0A6A3M6C1_9STRA|nr:hypothetical protein PF011_g2797 [Phytophthora fragariae]
MTEETELTTPEPPDGAEAAAQRALPLLAAAGVLESCGAAEGNAAGTKKESVGGGVSGVGPLPQTRPPRQRTVRCRPELTRWNRVVKRRYSTGGRVHREAMRLARTGN